MLEIFKIYHKFELIDWVYLHDKIDKNIILYHLIELRLGDRIHVIIIVRFGNILKSVTTYIVS